MGTLHSDGICPCGDYRMLNARTPPGRYPVLHVDDFAQHLAATFQTIPWKKFCDSGEPKIIVASENGTGEVSTNSIVTPRSWLVIVNKEELGIELNLIKFNLEDFFLVIEDGERGASPDSMIQFISGKSKKSLLFKIPFAKSFYIEICPEHSQVSPTIQGSFHLTYKRVEPEFDDSLPDEHLDQQKEKESYEVQFKGQPPETFKQGAFATRFKEAVKNIARDFCATSNITFNEGEPADTMVTIFSVRKCPLEWFESDFCASVRHSIFVLKKTETSSIFWNYELTAKHLKEMWGKANNSYLEGLNLSIYKLPNKEEVFGWWFLIIVLSSILIVSFTLFTSKLCNCFMDDKQKMLPMSTQSEVTQRRRKSKLKPNKYQTIPNFMTNQIKRNELQKGGNSETFEQGNYYAALLFSNRDLGPRYGVHSH